MSESADYAIIKSGGKQYKVQPGQTLLVDRLDPEVVKSSNGVVKVEEVLAVHRNGESTVGAPLVTGASVTLKVIGEEKAKKVIIYKKRRRKGYTKKQGHRQLKSRVTVESISA